MPYEGFVEITLTLVGKKDSFSIRVPFLVTPAKIDQTLIGFNVICELIRANSSENTRELLLDAMLSSFNSVDDTQLKTGVYRSVGRTIYVPSKQLRKILSFLLENRSRYRAVLIQVQYPSVYRFYLSLSK